MALLIDEKPTEMAQEQQVIEPKPKTKRKAKALAVVPTTDPETDLILISAKEAEAARLGTTSKALEALDKRQRLRLAVPKDDLVLEALHKRRLTYVGPINLAGKRIPKDTLQKMLTYLPPDKSVEDVIASQEHFLASAVWRGPQNLLVIATVDETPRYGPLLHVSISYPKRNPAWNEIKAIRYALFPQWMDVSMMLPAAEDYISLHNYCFHLHQTPERWLMR